MRRITMFACSALKPPSRRIVAAAGAMTVAATLVLTATQPAGAVRAGAATHHTAAEEAAYFEVGFLVGRIVKRPAPYNPRWHFHIDPATINFFQHAIEVCDAQPRYVEDHLDEAGGAFLPGLVWCPWTSRLVREVRPS